MLNVVMARAFAVDIQMESSGNEQNIFFIVFLVLGSSNALRYGLQRYCTTGLRVLPFA